MGSLLFSLVISFVDLLMQHTEHVLKWNASCCVLIVFACLCPFLVVSFMVSAFC